MSTKLSGTQCWCRTCRRSLSISSTAVPCCLDMIANFTGSANFPCSMILSLFFKTVRWMNDSCYKNERRPSSFHLDPLSLLFSLLFRWFPQVLSASPLRLHMVGSDWTALLYTVTLGSNTQPLSCDCVQQTHELLLWFVCMYKCSKWEIHAYLWKFTTWMFLNWGLIVLM